MTWPHALPVIPLLCLTLTLVTGSDRSTAARLTSVASASHQAPAGGATDPSEGQRPKLRLGPIPAITLGPRQPLTPDQAARVKASIVRLADIERIDSGFSPSMRGPGFLPVVTHRHVGSPVRANHRRPSSEPLQTLVELGPGSLPFLLEALEGRTPTKLDIDNRWTDGKLRPATELWGNPANEREVSILGPRPDEREVMRGATRIDAYTIKVGDVSLVAIGQIVGRRYRAVSDLAPAGIAADSATENPQLRAQVRALWSGPDPARLLFDSLLTDYATEGVYQGRSLDGWDLGSSLQVEAILRLLYYFPKESAPLVAARLRGLPARWEAAQASDGKGGDQRAFIRRQVAYGVRVENFLAAVAWCQEPPVRDALWDLFRRSQDADVLVGALPATGGRDAAAVRERVASYLRSLPDTPSGAYDGARVLQSLYRAAGAGAEPVMRGYATAVVSSPLRCRSLCSMLGEAERGFAAEMLEPFLTDKRATGWSYGGESPGQRTWPMRVCDVAACSLHKTDPGLKFALDGSHAELDAQIDALRAALARRKR